MRAWFRPNRNWGQVVAGVWFLAYGLFALVPKLNFEGGDTVLAVGALVAGILLILGR